MRRHKKEKPYDEEEDTSLHMVEKPSMTDNVLHAIVVVICAIIAFCSIIPMWHVLMASFSDGRELMVHTGINWKWVGQFSIDGYKHVFKDASILSGYANTLLYTFATTFLGFVLSAVTGYVLSRDTRLKPLMAAILMITMLFSGGMVPTYMVIRALGW